MSQSVTPQTILKQKQDILTADLVDELVLMSIDNSAYYGMNKVSKRIWELLAEPRVVSDVCHILLTEFDITFDVCQKEVLTFIRHLAEAQLVEIMEA